MSGPGTPIAIPIGPRNCSGGYDSEEGSSSSSSDDGRHFPVGTAGGGGRGAGDGGDLTVGSLPSTRRERRRIAASGVAGAGGAGVGGGLAYSGSLDHGAGTAGGLSGGAGLARSTPPPRAPFLSYRRESGDKLSRMPQMSLPESALDHDQFDGPSSVPYGSLRDSLLSRQFASRRRGRHHGSGGGAGSRHVRFARGGGSPIVEGKGEGEGDIYPQSVPSDFHSDLARKRWQQEHGGGRNKDGPSPLNLDIGSAGIEVGGAPLPRGGAGADDRDGRGRQQSSLSAQLGNLTLSSSPGGGADGSISTGITSAGGGDIGGGICSAVEGILVVAPSSSGIGAGVGRRGDDCHGGGGGAPRGYSFDSNDDGTNGIGDESSALGTSLTALDILSSSRSTPGGLGVHLGSNEATLMATAMSGVGREGGTGAALDGGSVDGGLVPPSTSGTQQPPSVATAAGGAAGQASDGAPAAHAHFLPDQATTRPLAEPVVYGSPADDDRLPGHQAQELDHDNPDCFGAFDLELED